MVGFRDADLPRELFETVVRRCTAEGLVGGEGLAVDASMIVADAHRQRGVATPDRLDPNANRAVAEYLATLDNATFGAHRAAKQSWQDVPLNLMGEYCEATVGAPPIADGQKSRFSDGGPGVGGTIT